MLKFPRILTLFFSMVFVVMLFPVPAVPQDKTAAPADERTAVPEQGQLITPRDEKPAEAAGLKSSETTTEAAEVDEASETEAPSTVAVGESRQYTIKKGDTLWDLSNSFLHDPFLWPFIWKANPSITNADLIYPGNLLVIPNMAEIERALKAPEAAPVQAAPVKPQVEKKVAVEQKPEPKAREGIASAEVVKPVSKAEVATEETTTGSRLILPEEQPVPIIDKYAMLSAGFINSEDAFGSIDGSPEDAKTRKTQYGYGDIVYVSLPKIPVTVGDKFLIYTPLDRVKHPKKGRLLGRLIRGLGILQITEKNSDVLTAKITLSFDTISKGDALTPYQEPALVYNPKQRPGKEISGYIIKVTDNRTITGTLDIVYLDKGSADGVEPGDRFVVYNEPGNRSFPRKLVGEIQVFIVKPNTSTAVVRKSSETIEIGDEIEYKK